MRNRAKEIIVVAACLLIVPIVGIFIGQSVEHKYDDLFVGAVAKALHVPEGKLRSSGISLKDECAKDHPSLREYCSYENDILFFQKASWLAFVSGLIAMLVVFLVRVSAAGSRRRLATLFSPTTFFSIAFLATSIAAQGAILVYGVYIVEVVTTERYHPKLIGALGLGAAVAAFVLIKSALTLFRAQPTTIFGRRVDAESAPGLIEMVGGISDRMRARKPDNVIVGLEPNFFVTAAKVRLPTDPEPLNGTTLYLSLPFLSIFKKEELAAVIGHELGHFKGEDTEYSMRFYPAYSRLYRALGAMEQQSGSGNASAIFAAPAVTTLSLVLSEFGVIERTIGRERELAADREGALVSSGPSLINALLKMSAYGGLWGGLREHNISKLAEGSFYSNLAGIYCVIATSQFEELDFSAAQSSLLSYQASHPTDTHPSLSERMRSLGVTPTTIDKENLRPADVPFGEYISNPDALSEELSLDEHRIMVASGRVVIPEAPASDEPASNPDVKQ